MSEEKRRPDPPTGRGPARPGHDNRNIRGMIADIEKKLSGAISSESINGLNSFERKLIHRHFDHNEEYETRTYRNGDKYTVCIYPVTNIEKFAQEKAEESRESGDTVDLPPMGSYERYLIHNSLKDSSGIETVSQGEGKDRHVQIVSKRFGRGLKRIAKKIKLF